jgi:hypothetical protein
MRKKKVFELDLTHTVHGRILADKCAATKDKVLFECFREYEKYRFKIDCIKILDDSSIIKLVNYTNAYRNKCLKPLEHRANSGQENLRSSILEEFFYHLLKDLVASHFFALPKNLIIGKGDSYVDLTFSPSSFQSAFASPNPYFHTKVQDFVLGCGIVLSVEGVENPSKRDIVIPIVAIECKTYIESNMLDSSAGSARRLKSAMPYCLCIIAAEYMKMEDVSPELTDIDEVYILCKASNSERLYNISKNKPPHLIKKDLILDLYTLVKRHLQSVWWSPEDALSRGKVINRP